MASKTGAKKAATRELVAGPVKSFIAPKNVDELLDVLKVFLDHTLGLELNGWSTDVEGGDIGIEFEDYTATLYLVTNRERTPMLLTNEEAKAVEQLRTGGKDFAQLNGVRRSDLLHAGGFRPLLDSARTHLRYARNGHRTNDLVDGMFMQKEASHATYEDAMSVLGRMVRLSHKVRSDVILSSPIAVRVDDAIVAVAAYGPDPKGEDAVMILEESAIKVV
jgi:hypothetical protein